MAKFVYRMQSILDIKYKLEEQERTAYSIANGKLAEKNQKHQTLLIRRAGYERRAKELAVGTIDVQSIQENKRAIDTMKSLIREQMMQVNIEEKNVELARKRLNDVMVERKVQEKLREKAFEEFKVEVAAKEAQEVDELTSFTYATREAK